MPASQACKYNVASSSSALSFDAKTTLHAVHGTGAQLTGTIAASTEGGVLALDPAPAMHVEFPTERLSSGNALQDRQTWKLLESERQPTIMADLTSLTSSGGNLYHATGEITLGGRKKTYEGDMTIKLDRDRMVVDGSLVVDIRDFGIQPPRLLGMTVAPQVSVNVHLVATLDMGT